VTAYSRSHFVSHLRTVARSIRVGVTEVSDEADDGKLVEALRTRDATAMRALYLRYSDRIFRFLYRMTANRAVADDLHQETWLAVARNITTLRPDSDLAAWLFTIARNKHRSWCRWGALADRFAIHWDGQTGSDATRSPGDPHDGSWQHAFHPQRQDNLRDLEKLLVRLSPPLHEVLLLVGCEGLDASQAARVLGLTAEAVRQRVSRARTALRRMMTEADDLAAARAKRKEAQ
jgi:RNA polymerase sigma factor (sigma-70 family)